MKNSQKNRFTKIILFVSLLISSLTSFAQSSDWTKDDRNNIYEEYLNALTKYRNITQEQKESISLCCLKEITEKYNKKEFHSKIEVELKRIREATISTCAKNVGVNLGETSIKEETKETKSGIINAENFSGTWTSNVGDYTFTATDGTYTCKSATERGCMNDRGDFVIKGKKVIISSTRTFCGWSAGTFTIASVSSDEIVLVDYSGREMRLIKMK